MAGEKEGISSVDRALEVLLVLQNYGQEMGVTQIAAAMGLHKSTVHRTLATLEQKGFVQQNMQTGRYWLGLKLYSIAMTMREKLPINRIARPYAQELADAFNEGVHLAVLDRSSEEYPRQIVIDKIESQKILSLTPPVGSTTPAHCSALGKCLLAYAGEAFLNRFLEHPLPAFTEKTITSWDVLQQELAEIRRDGYGTDKDELEWGLTCIAAPILGASGEIVAAISLSGPSSRIQGEQKAQIIDGVRQAAAAISQAMR